MPRRKTSVLDKVDVTAESRVKAEISKALSTFPPALYALLAETPAQKQKFNGERAFYGRVGAIIDSYFNGSAPPNYDSMPKYEREETWNEAWQYLAFYGLVFANWDVVQKAIQAEGPPLLPQQKTSSCRFELAGAPFEHLTTPLSVALEAMRYRALSRMSGAFSVEPVSMSAYQVRNSGRRVNKARRSNAPQSLKAAVQAGENKLYEELIPWAKLERLCVLAVVDSKPKGAKKAKLDEYTRSSREKEKHLAKKYHKRNRQTGYRWENGLYEQN